MYSSPTNFTKTTFFFHWKGAKPKKNYIEIEIMQGVGTPEELKEHNWSTPNAGASNNTKTTFWEPRVSAKQPIHSPLLFREILWYVVLIRDPN
jgi:hypothetical protein